MDDCGKAMELCMYMLSAGRGSCSLVVVLGLRCGFIEEEEEGLERRRDVYKDPLVNGCLVI